MTDRFDRFGWLRLGLGICKSARSLRRMLVAFAVCLSITPLDASGLSWDHTELTLQPATAAKKVAAEFRFRNLNGTPIGIVAIEPSCDCLSAKADKISYLPGESGVISVEFALEGREGRQEKIISIATSDAPRNPIVLKLLIELPQPVTLRPRRLFWRVGDDPVEKEIEVAFAEPAVARVNDILCPEPSFRARLISEGKNNIYRVGITPTSTARIAQATVRVNATVSGQTRVFVLYAGVKR